jgi:hypothetical protein
MELPAHSINEMTDPEEIPSGSVVGRYDGVSNQAKSCDVTTALADNYFSSKIFFVSTKLRFVPTPVATIRQ